MEDYQTTPMSKELKKKSEGKEKGNSVCLFVKTKYKKNGSKHKFKINKDNGSKNSVTKKGTIRTKDYLEGKFKKNNDGENDTRKVSIPSKGYLIDNCKE